jgi:hypothetical protein
VDGSAIVAGGKAPEILQAAKASFDLIAMLVGGFVVRDEAFRFRLEGITASAFMPAIRSRKSLLS